MTTVLLTGASGFLGAHTLRALLDNGHEVRAFVRTPAKLAAALTPLGVDAADPRITVASGNMTDEAAVREAVSDCGAVIHAAATYSFKRSDAASMLRDNVAGTERVLQAGIDAGCEALVHVSSTVALASKGGATLDNESELGPGHGPYSKSKVASEQVARELQLAGAPVTIVNPGGVIGPHDPYLGESNTVLKELLEGKLAVFPRGRLPYVDVRDTAATLVAAVEQPVARGKRYLVPAHAVPNLHEVMRGLTGRRLPVLLVPGILAQLGTLPGYLTGWSFLPGAIEGARITACDNRLDSARTTEDLGVSAMPFEDSARDTVRWLVEAGHLPAKLAGSALA